MGITAFNDFVAVNPVRVSFATNLTGQFFNLFVTVSPARPPFLLGEAKAPAVQMRLGVSRRLGLT